MFSRDSLFRILFLISLIAFFTACNPNNDDDSTPSVDSITGGQPGGEPPPEMKIELSDVSDTCLNLGKYFEAIRTLPPTTKVRKFTSDARFRATGGSLPQNTLARYINGSFEIQDSDLSQVYDFPAMAQSDCKTVSLAGENHSVPYKITEANKDSLTYETEWKGEVTIKWLSSTSLEITETSIVEDDLCSTSAKGKLTRVYQVRWGDASILTETIGERSIRSSFLSAVADAAGFSMANLFANSPAFSLALEEVPVEPVAEDNSGPERMLSVSQLKALDTLPVRADLRHCY